MLDPAAVRTASQLLVEGRLSQREIARQVGISRGSVGRIASGRRPDYEARPRAGEDEEMFSKAATRCRKCGAMVFLPRDGNGDQRCHECRIKARKEKPEKPQRAQRTRREEGVVVGLELEGADKWRYEQIRKYGIATARPGAPRRSLGRRASEQGGGLADGTRREIDRIEREG